MKRFNIILFLLALVVLTVEAKDLRVAGIFGNNSKRRPYRYGDGRMPGQ